MEAHFGALKAPERTRKHISGAKSILTRELGDRRLALAALSDRKCPKGAQMEPPQTGEGFFRTFVI